MTRHLSLVYNADKDPSRNGNAAAEREAARRSDGRFGTQTRPEASIGDGGIDLLADGPPSALSDQDSAPSFDPAGLRGSDEEAATTGPVGVGSVGAGSASTGQVSGAPTVHHLTGSPTQRNQRGERYQAADVTDIAKDVRSFIKELRQAGEIPAGWRTSVRTSRFAGGQAIDVSIDNVETEEYYDFQWDEMVQRPTPEAALVIAKIEERLESHNRDNSDVMTDYFDVHFYGNVTCNGRSSGAWSEKVCADCRQYYPCPC